MTFLISGGTSTMLAFSRHRAAKRSSSIHDAKIRAHPCLATRFGGVSGGKETHGRRVSLATRAVSASLGEPPAWLDPVEAVS